MTTVVSIEQTDEIRTVLAGMGRQQSLRILLSANVTGILFQANPQGINMKKLLTVCLLLLCSGSVMAVQFDARSH